MPDGCISLSGDETPEVQLDEDLYLWDVTICILTGTCLLDLTGQSWAVLFFFWH